MNLFNIFKILYFMKSTKLIIFLILFVINVHFGNIVDAGFIMPCEGDPHAATWMAYGATIAAWGNKGSYGASRLIARKDIMRIAANLARFERVKIIINEDDLDEAEQFLNEVKNETESVNTGGRLVPPIEASGKIEFIVQPVDDLWTRDTGPVFVFDDENFARGINFNFNGWGQEDTGAYGWRKSSKKAANGIVDQRIKEDQKIGDFIIQRTGVEGINTFLVMEGGGIEVNGKGTAICTESCILNDNRNPGISKKEVEEELHRLLGIKKVIWLPGVKGMDITDGHVDFYARFVSDTEVVCLLDNNKDSPDYHTTHQNLEILSNVYDAFGNKITVIPLVSPDFNKVKKAVINRNGWWNHKNYFNNDAFAAGYIGFYVANDCVMMVKFGDDTADKKAYDTISLLFPNRVVMQITTDGIANAGGTIHCSTQQQILQLETGIQKFERILKYFTNRL